MIPAMTARIEQTMRTSRDSAEGNLSEKKQDGENEVDLDRDVVVERLKVRLEPDLDKGRAQEDHKEAKDQPELEV